MDAFCQLKEIIKNAQLQFSQLMDNANMQLNVEDYYLGDKFIIEEAVVDEADAEDGHQTHLSDAEQASNDESQHSESFQQKLTFVNWEEEKQSLDQLLKTRSKPGNRKNNKQHICDICQSVFPTQLRLHGHMRTDHDQKPIKCPHCDRRFSTKSNMNLHLRIHTPVEERTLTHICHICAKPFETIRSLKQHLITHEQTVSLQCPICLKHVFDLKRHTRMQHSGKPKPVCSICGKETSRLSKHIQMHHTESKERHACGVCHKEFRWPTHLKKHENIHKGLRVKCEFCPHQATTSGNLYTHMRSQHPKEVDGYKARMIQMPKFKEI